MNDTIANIHMDGFDCVPSFIRPDDLSKVVLNHIPTWAIVGYFSISQSIIVASGPSHEGRPFVPEGSELLFSQTLLSAIFALSTTIRIN
ncbi:hypothetical protein [Pseudomonas pergaminensis]